MSRLRRLAPLFVRRNWRRFWRWLRSPHFHVVYHEGYNAGFPNVPHDDLRAERILAFLASEGLVAPCDVHKPLPVTLKALRRIHPPEHLESLHEVETLTSIMGVEISDHQVDRLIDIQRLQAGGTILAVKLALARGFAVNLGGGFHHAHAGRGGGFCLMNDVAVAIAEARVRGFSGRVLVVDLDLHDGDGTRAIFAGDREVHTFSVHAAHWDATDDGEEATSVELGSKVEDDKYLEAVESRLPALFKSFRPQLVVYVAGTDPAREDRLGDWQITPEGMRRRDTLVARLARRRRHRIPLAMVLAGGYSRESWRYTARFLSDPFGERGAIEPPTTDVMTLKRYRYISGLFSSAELSGAASDTSFGFTEEDLFLPGAGFHKETRFLSFYTRHGIELVLERSGILDRLRDLGFVHPTLDFDLDDPAGHTLRIFGAPDREEVLVELRLRRDRRTVGDMELLSIEWLLLQNPRASFSEVSRRPLPGQTHPGLGMLKDVVALLAMVCERLHLDGVGFVPSQYHIAVQWHGYLYFLEEEARLRYEALRKLFGDMPIGEASRAVAEGRVIDEATGEAFKWQPAPMVAPINERLKAKMNTKSSGDQAPELRLRLLDGSEH